MRRLLLFCLALSLMGWALLQAGTTGKIAGTITDAETGEKLAGVNVVIEGTSMGAATNLEGYFVILNVPPGVLNLRASSIGYAAQRINNVTVKIDLTTEINMQLESEALAGEAVVVVAERPVVQKDISSSQANLSAAEIQALPVVNVSSVVGLEAGVRGTEIRGGSTNETAYLLNGIALRDERDNTPFTGISYTSISEVQVQTGGFNAEYGNIRSGLVNVVTKEGGSDRYTLSLQTRYRAPDPKHFGPSPTDRNSYYIRPYVDETVAWTGTTSGAWDAFTRLQYPEFEGWNSIAQKTLTDDDPNNDLTPQAAQELFLWQHRRVLDVQDPDYDFDASFGGPVPAVSANLGNLRFLASYRTTQTAYVIPLSQDQFRDWTGQLKLVSDLGPGKKLTVEGLLAKARGTNSNNAGLPGIFRSPTSIAGELNRVSFIDSRIFAPDYWAPTEVRRNSMSAKFTHTLSANTFYEAALHRFASRYETHPGRPRNTEIVRVFGNNYGVDEAPFGFIASPTTGIDGLRMSVGFSNSRDSSEVTTWTGRFDLNSQLDRYNFVKAGVEFIYTDNNVNYASVDEFLPSGRSRSSWHTFPKRGALYLQDKLEFEGMIANVGLRLDYAHAGGEWYVYDVYDRAFTSEQSLGLDTLLAREPTKHIFNLSPRLGVAFPITVNSKLFFNYGHFRQMPTPENLYLLRRFTDNYAVTRLAEPNNPLPKTVAYELGYEHNLFDQYLLRVAGYYKDVSLDTFLVRYKSRDSAVNYQRSEPNSYADIRGFELTVRKNRGAWVQGFLNYTYMVKTKGFFGLDEYNQDPTQQREIESDRVRFDQERPLARPYARANLDFFTPDDFGPRWLGTHLLGDWRLNLLASWEAGFHLTWAGGGGASIPGIQDNVQWQGFSTLDLRLSKGFRIANANVQFFMDVNNALNLKQMNASVFDYGYGFVDGRDFDAYMRSLHLPDEVAGKLGYGNIPGDDRPGDYRKGPYIPWDQNADEATKDEWRKNKSYIDMPNFEFLTFLNPREIFWGLKIAFDVY
ncbi:MAG: TonB-dependent receptor [bacterium]